MIMMGGNHGVEKKRVNILKKKKERKQQRQQNISHPSTISYFHPLSYFPTQRFFFKKKEELKIDQDSTPNLLLSASCSVLKRHSNFACYGSSSRFFLALKGLGWEGVSLVTYGSGDEGSWVQDLCLGTGLCGEW